MTHLYKQSSPGYPTPSGVRLRRPSAPWGWVREPFRAASGALGLSPARLAPRPKSLHSNAFSSHAQAESCNAEVGDPPRGCVELSPDSYGPRAPASSRGRFLTPGLPGQRDALRAQPLPGAPAVSHLPDVLRAEAADGRRPLVLNGTGWNVTLSVTGFVRVSQPLEMRARA